MDQDPLAPHAMMFPLTPLQSPHSDEQPSGKGRPFALRGAIRPIPVESRHRTPYTNKPQKTTHRLDNQVVTDTYVVPDT